MISDSPQLGAVFLRGVFLRKQPNCRVLDVSLIDIVKQTEMTTSVLVKQLRHNSLLSFSLLLLTRCQSIGVSDCCCLVWLHRAVNYRISKSIFHRPYYQDEL